ncbi:MAG: beta-galactosidase [Phycisphaerales bacterium]
MSVLTFDGQSFTVDGKRIWLVGGTIEYSRTPRELWPVRIAQARAAGLNTVTTSVIWSRHEPRPGQFDFAGDNDLAHFVDLVGRAGMYVILRMGPFVGGGFDMGGLPSWLLLNANVNLRTNNGPFLEASSRYINAVARQVRDRQITSVIGPKGESKPGGPIVLIQNESGWTCGHDAMAHGYLGELHRYLRESGFDVPFVNANDLWQGVEGEIDGWTGTGSQLRNLRQLATVRPAQPRLVMEYRFGEQLAWGEKDTTHEQDAIELQRGLVEILASGSQFNIEPFAGGTNFGFSGGRLTHSGEAFSTTSADRTAPVSEAGTPRETFHALRRVAMFASRFGRQLSHLDPKRQSICLLPHGVAGEIAAKHDVDERNPSYAVLHCSGTQGSVVFVFAPERDGAGHGVEHEPATLLLQDGTLLPVHLGEQPVGWCLIDTRLIGRSQLDYCNLSAIATAGRVFVCAGPKGAPGRLSINGADISAEVPEDDEPLVLDHEGVVVCIVNDHALSKLHIADDAVYMDVDGLTLEGLPVVSHWGQKFRKLSGEARWETVVAEEHPKRPAPKIDNKPAPLPRRGKGAKAKSKTPVVPVAEPELPPLPPSAAVVPVAKAPGRIALGAWTTSVVDDYLDGSGPRYASIAGPADLNALGAPSGYGWYRLTLKNGGSRKAHVAFPQGSDRLAIFSENTAAGVLGFGPGASPEVAFHLSRGEQTLVVLAENLGRFAGGANLGESKGICGHLWEVAAVKAGKPELKRCDPIDTMAFKAPQWQVHQGDSTDTQRLTWTLHHKRKTPVLLTLRPGQHRGLIVINNKPVKVFDPSGPATLLLDEAALSRGNVEVQLALLGDAEASMREMADALGFLECVENLSAKAEWAFAKWERPGTDRFVAEGKRSHVAHAPRWWRSTFALSDARAPLSLEVAGLSKGQAYVNGRHLGRYFTATGAGKNVGPQTSLLIPAPFLHAGKDNEVMIFDEHGFNPSKVRIVAAV